MINFWNITREQIRELRAEAAAFNDGAMVAICDHALGDAVASPEMSRAELRLANEAIDAVLGPWDAKRGRRALDVLRTLIGPSYDPRLTAGEHAVTMAPWLASNVDRVRDAVYLLAANPENSELAAVRAAWKARP